MMPTTTASGLVYEEKVVGTGDTAQSGQNVSAGGVIPPNATLIFEVELLAIEK